MQVSRLRLFIRLALAAMLRSWAVTAMTIATISVALAILGAFAVVAGQLRSVSDRLGAQLAISAYLEDGTPPVEGTALASQVREWPEVADVQHWTPAAALEAFRDDLAEDAVILDGLPETVMPASVELTLSGTRSLEDIRRVAERLRTMPGVVEVRFGEERLERLQLLTRLIEVTFLVLGAALLLGTLFIVANTVRLTVFARRDEIEVLRLVGATGSFVGAPFVIEGMMQGLLGGALAWLWLALVDSALRAGLERMLQIAYGSFSAPISLSPWLAPLVLTGVVLGVLGSGLAVGRFLRV